MPGPVLELRDPNSGQDPDPATKPRHQYAVTSDGLGWHRVLPPAPLKHEVLPEDCDVPWELRLFSGVVREWAEPHGYDAYATARALAGPERVSDNPPAWRMPPRSPVDRWVAITGAPCPVSECGQTLVWWEAGYAPGYRVCMEVQADGSGRVETIRHHLTLMPERQGMVLALVCEEE